MNKILIKQNELLLLKSDYFRIEIGVGDIGYGANKDAKIRLF